MPPWSRSAGLIARVLVAGRWLILLGWIALAGLAFVRIPPLVTSGGGLGDLTSITNPALVTEQRSMQDFGFPLLSRIVMVQHDPAGLPPSVAADAAQRALAVAQSPGGAPIAAAVPVPGTTGVPAVRRPGTTIVTYLFPHAGQSANAAMRGARTYAASFGPSAHVVGVTGTLPGRADQQAHIDAALPLVELVSVVAVLLIVGLAFRSLVAPMLTLASAGLSYLLIMRVAALVAAHEGWQIPTDLQPLMVALMLGVTTDYVVYFLAGMRAELADGHARTVAARRTTAMFAPIVAVAGLTICAGVATLLLASSPAVRAFGPAMAVSVLVAVAVSVTFLPAAIAVLGRVAFWPSRVAVSPSEAAGGLLRRGTVRVVRTRIGALLVAVVCIAGLGALAVQAQHLRVGLPMVSALPSDDQAARAARAAAQGFAPGITSPTLVEVRPAAGTSPTAFRRLEELLRRQPHVAGVLGPQEDAAISAAAGRPVGAFLRTSGSAGTAGLPGATGATGATGASGSAGATGASGSAGAGVTAARYLVILDQDPLDAVSIGAVNQLERRLPALLAQAGLPASSWHGVGGDTAAIAAVIHEMNRDLARVVVAALLVNLLLLVIFLRALVAPVFLLACTALSVAATLGLTELVFQHRLGHPGITFFVPLTTGVLLIALGSDYNLFAIGHVWEEARRQRLRDAMLTALPRSSRAITTAGIALAATLGTLALVPLRQFQELAFALAAGIVIDALIVRTLLAPALLGLFGRFSGWPGHRLDDPVTGQRARGQAHSR